VIPANETFDGTWPYAPHFSTAAGFRMHYVDEGRGEPIICLHGEPTWGYLYRNFIGPLSESHRDIVPDHMGFGKSETPHDREYRYQTHVENLAAFIEDLNLHDITFVAQDWGGVITGAYTVRWPERVKRLCLMNTLCGYGGGGDVSSSAWFRWIAQGLENGSYHEVLGNLGSTILSVMKIIGFENTGAVNDAWLRAYQMPFLDENGVPSKDECKAGIEFPLDVAHGYAMEYLQGGFGGVEALKSKSAMLVEGMCDHAIPPEVALADFQALWPRGPIVKLPNAGHFCQEDAPEIIVPLIQQFMQMT